MSDEPRPRPKSVGVDLLWIPLGAGGHVVRVNGKVFEAITAFVHRRPRQDLYHAALEISARDAAYVIELAPIPDRDGPARGVVGTGPVGTRWLGHFRVFRYELRRWRGGRSLIATMRSGAPTGWSRMHPSSTAFSSWCPPSRPRCGDATSSTRARCGTRTPSSPGSWSVPASTSTTSIRRKAVGLPVGTPASSSLNVQLQRTTHVT